MASEAQAKGGRVRAKKLSAKRRKEIASIAAIARWSRKPQIINVSPEGKDFAAVIEESIALAQSKNPEFTRQQALHHVCSDWLKRVQA